MSGRGQRPGGQDDERRRQFARGGGQLSKTRAKTIAPATSSETETDVLDTPAAGGMVIRGGALRLAGYASVVALSAVSAALLTRHLGVDHYGEYNVVMALVGLVAMVTDAGMSALGIREFAVLSGKDRDSLMRDLLGLRLVLTCAGVILSVAFALVAGYDTSLLLGTVLASSATFALVAQHTLSIPISAELRLGTASALDLGRQALTVAAIAALVVLGAGLLPLLGVNLFAYLLLLPATARLSRGHISLRASWSPRRWMALLRTTVAFSLATAVGTIYVYTAQILMSLVASAHQTGLFATSFRIFMVAATVPGLLVGAALPLLARAGRDDRRRLAYGLRRIFEVSLVLGVGAALGVFAGARFVIELITGPQFSEYAGSVTVLQIQGIALAASFMVAGSGYALLTLSRYRGLLAVNAMALAVSCVLTLVLARSDGAEGAAIATLCGETTLAVGCALVLGAGDPDLRPSLARAPRVVVAAVPAIVLMLTLNLPSIALTAIVLSSYALAIVLTRAMPPEIAELIPRRTARKA